MSRSPRQPRRAPERQVDALISRQHLSTDQNARKMSDLQQQSVKIEQHNARIQLKLSPEDREAEILRYAPSSSPDGEDQPRSPSGDSLGPETSHESEQTHSPHLTPPATDDDDHDRTTVELRLLVRRREAGALIGRRGANIKRLREQFRNSIFSIPDTGNGPERVVCVATGERSVGPILDELTQVLVEKSGECDDQLELKLLIHSSQAGSIIGLGGQSIKKLRNVSHHHQSHCPTPQPASRSLVAALTFS